MTHVIEHPRITEVGRLLARIADLETVCEAFKNEAHRLSGLLLAKEQENDALRQVLRELAQGWTNVLELDLIPSQHRATAEILRDKCHAAIDRTRM